MCPRGRLSYGTLVNSMGPPPRYQNLSSLTAKLADRVRNPKSFSHPLTQTLRNHLLYVHPRSSLMRGLGLGVSP